MPDANDDEAELLCLPTEPEPDPEDADADGGADDGKARKRKVGDTGGKGGKRPA